VATLEPAAGKRVELEEAFGAYTGACEAEGKRAVPHEVRRHFF